MKEKKFHERTRQPCFFEREWLRLGLNNCVFFSRSFGLERVRGEVGDSVQWRKRKEKEERERKKNGDGWKAKGKCDGERKVRMFGRVKKIGRNCFIFTFALFIFLFTLEVFFFF